MARLSYLLATIKTDVALSVHADDLKHDVLDEQALLALFTEYEFKSWIDELSPKGATKSTAIGEDGDKSPPKKPSPTGEYTIILDEKTFEQWLDTLKNSELFAFDTETTSLNYMEAEIVGVSFAVEAGKAAYVPCGHDYLDAPAQLSREVVLSKLKPLLEDENLKKVGQHLKYDRNVLLNYDITLNGIAFDTMLESYVTNSVASRHDMDSLASFYLDKQTIHSSS